VKEWSGQSERKVSYANKAKNIQAPSWDGSISTKRKLK